MVRKQKVEIFQVFSVIAVQHELARNGKSMILNEFEMRLIQEAIKDKATVVDTAKRILNHRKDGQHEWE